MRRYIASLLTCFLIPCLIMDSALALPLRSTTNSPSALFLPQAFSARAVDAWSGWKKGHGSVMQQEARAAERGSTRLEFLNQMNRLLLSWGPWKGQPRSPADRAYRRLFENQNRTITFRQTFQGFTPTVRSILAALALVAPNRPLDEILSTQQQIWERIRELNIPELKTMFAASFSPDHFNDLVERELVRYLADQGLSLEFDFNLLPDAYGRLVSIVPIPKVTTIASIEPAPERSPTMKTIPILFLGEQVDLVSGARTPYHQEDPHNFHGAAIYSSIDFNAHLDDTIAAVQEILNRQPSFIQIHAGADPSFSLQDYLLWFSGIRPRMTPLQAGAELVQIREFLIASTLSRAAIRANILYEETLHEKRHWLAFQNSSYLDAVLGPLGDSVSSALTALYNFHTHIEVDASIAELEEGNPADALLSARLFLNSQTLSGNRGAEHQVAGRWILNRLTAHAVKLASQDPSVLGVVLNPLVLLYPDDLIVLQMPEWTRPAHEKAFRKMAHEVREDYRRIQTWTFKPGQDEPIAPPLWQQIVSEVWWWGPAILIAIVGIVYVLRYRRRPPSTGPLSFPPPKPKVSPSADRRNTKKNNSGTQKGARKNRAIPTQA